MNGGSQGTISEKDKHLPINLFSDFLSPFSLATGSVCSGETDAHIEGARGIILYYLNPKNHEIRESPDHHRHRHL